MQIPIQLFDIEGEGFHLMMQGKINGMEALFLIDTGASRSVFDPTSITKFIEKPKFKRKKGTVCGLGGDKLKSATFTIASLTLGDIELNNYEAVALDMQIVNKTYSKLGIPPIDGIIGSDILYRLKATINYRLRKIRFTKPKSKAKPSK